MRMLIGGLLSFGAWLVNTGGLSSPLIPIGLGMLLPALLVFDTRKQMWLFSGGALAVLGGVALVSLWPVGALVAPLAPRNGHPSPEFVALVAGSILVTASQVSAFWGHVAAAYDQVAIELGARREELCSVGEDRTRELEGAAAHLAHEMKNPLASIKCLSTHLARGCSLDARTVERLEVVSAAADRLESIVDGFVSLSRGLGDLDVRPCTRSRWRVSSSSCWTRALRRGGRAGGLGDPGSESGRRRAKDPPRAVLPGDERRTGLAGGSSRDHRRQPCEAAQAAVRIRM